MSETHQTSVENRSFPASVAEVPVQVRFERQVSLGRWASVQWRVVEVAPSSDEYVTGPGSSQALRMALHRDEAEGCWLNLTSGDPSIFVLWRLDECQPDEVEPKAVSVTLSYAEAARWLDGGEQVDRVAMPPEMSAWLAEFVDRFYRPDDGRRKRRGTKPSFMRPDEFERMTAEEVARLMPAQGWPEKAAKT